MCLEYWCNLSFNATLSQIVNLVQNHRREVEYNTFQDLSSITETLGLQEKLNIKIYDVFTEIQIFNFVYNNIS